MPSRILGLMFLLGFTTLIGLLWTLAGHLGRRRVERRLENAVAGKDSSLSRRCLAELEQKYSEILDKERKAAQLEMDRKWTKAGKEEVEREFLESEKELMGKLNAYREQVDALEASLSSNERA